MSLKRVYEPLTIRGCEIPNRISRSAHATGLCNYGVITDRLIDYHVARAKGGVGLTILEGASIHPSSAASLCNYDDSIIDNYRKLMAAIRPHGMRVFQQLVHTGHSYPLFFTQQPPWGVTSAPTCLMGTVGSPMGQAEIDELIASYVAAAIRCREGGIEGVQIHSAHGYLMMQFLSPVINTRTDQYGGSLENRMRFLREVLTGVRKGVGDDYPVGIRMGASIAPAGVQAEELVQVIRSLEADNLIDFLDCSWTDYYEFRFVGAMDLPMGYQVPHSSKLTAATKVPRFVIGRFRTLDEAEQVLRDGVADMVHMTRAHIADPAIVRKTKAGFPEQVRACIGCNQACWFSSQGGMFPIACTINPAAGMEGTLDEDLIVPAAKPGHVLVIGGGPAGMEAARVARLRGHRVTLVEAGPDLGGQVAIAKRAPRLHTIGDIIFWLEQEIYRLGVEVRTNTYFEAENVLAEKPDFVVVATGAMPRGNGIQYQAPEAPVPGFDLPHVLSTEELLTSPHRDLGKTGLVFDDIGHYEALAAAEYMLSKGMAVTFATRYAMIGPNLDQLSRVEPALRRFAAGDFTPIMRAKLAKIGPSTCDVRTMHRAEPETVKADTVVFVTAREPMRDVYDELRQNGFVLGKNLAIAGDANAPRDLQFAISDGHRMVRAMV